MKLIDRKMLRSPLHQLDLLNREGSLEKLYMDLPGLSPPPSLLYLRQRESWAVPPSYRTGLAFFASILIVSALSLNAISAHSLAEARRDSLQEQILQNFGNLRLALEQYQGADGGHQVLPFSMLRDQSLMLNPDPFSPVTVLGKVKTIGLDQVALVESGLRLSQGYQDFQRFLESWTSAAPITDRLQWMSRSGQQALEAWDEALLTGNNLSQGLPEAQQELLDQSFGLVASLTNFLKSFESGVSPFLEILGHREPQRILVFLQDSHSKRATGGALSVGIELLLDDGQILSQKIFEVGEYDELLRVKLAPPETSGLSKMAPEWNLATANAFVDATQSAEQIRWFWQREARSSVDTIVLVNTSVFEKLFESENLHQAMNAEKIAQMENISLRWSAFRALGDTNGLNSITQAAWDLTLDLFSSPDLLLKVWPIWEELIREKQILIVSSDLKLQEKLSRWGFSGDLPYPSDHEDVLLVSSTNTEDLANDRWITEDHELHTAIKSDGSIHHWLQITRKQTWDDSYRDTLVEKIGFNVDRQTLKSISAAPNRSLMSVMVPHGSFLTSAEGIDLLDIRTSHQDGYTVWSFMSELNPGETQVAQLFYTLPWTFDTSSVDHYQLKLLHQPGSVSVGMKFELKLPADFTIFQQIPEEPIISLSRDLTIGIVAGKNP